MSDECYAHLMLTLAEPARAPDPLLAEPALARCVMRELIASAPHAPGRLWGYLVMPDSVRLVVGPVPVGPEGASREAFEAYVARVRQRTTRRLVAALVRRSDDRLDRVLRYHPMRGGVGGCVWQAGMQCLVLWSEARLSQALYLLRQGPVVAGLVTDPDDWPFVGWAL